MLCSDRRIVPDGKCYVTTSIFQYISFELTGCISELEPNLSTQGPSGNEAEGMHVGNQNQAGNQAQSGQTFSSQPFQSLPQVVQIPLAAGSTSIPSLSAVGIYIYFLCISLLIMFYYKSVHVY